MNTPTRSGEAVLPPTTSIPSAVQGLGAVVSRRHFFRYLHDRHGSAFTVNLPVFGPTVVISDAAMARELFTSGDKVENVQPNLGRILGTGSMFALEGARHRARRKLLTPPLHGKPIRSYEQIVVARSAPKPLTGATGSSSPASNR